MLTLFSFTDHNSKIGLMSLMYLPTNCLPREHPCITEAGFRCFFYPWPPLVLHYIQKNHVGGTYEGQTTSGKRCKYQLFKGQKQIVQSLSIQFLLWVEIREFLYKFGRLCKLFSIFPCNCKMSIPCFKLCTPDRQPLHLLELFSK